VRFGGEIVSFWWEFGSFTVFWCILVGSLVYLVCFSETRGVWGWYNTGFWCFEVCDGL